MYLNIKPYCIFDKKKKKPDSFLFFILFGSATHYSNALLPRTDEKQSETKSTHHSDNKYASTPQ